jgi:hypothetical protein
MVLDSIREPDLNQPQLPRTARCAVDLSVTNPL